jgi:D-alanyl-D-alanine carboxypeptidase (penicillin-binding protein 5/6)
MPLTVPSLRLPAVRCLFPVLLAFALLVSTASAAPGLATRPGVTMAISPPEVTAKSVYVVDMTSGVELYAKDPYAHLQVGSIVKIATALVVVNTVGLDEQVLIQESDLVNVDEYSNMALVAGDTLTVRLLLYGLLIPSGNDAARALARHVGSKLSGSEDARIATEAFVKEMNAYAATLGLKDSRFTVPDGIDTPNSYSSAYDVTILARELMKNETLRSIVREPAYRFVSVGPEARVYEKSTTNNRLGQSAVVGVKTGTTLMAGGNVVLAREVNGGTNMVLITIIGAEHTYTTGNADTPDARWTDADTIMSAMDASFTWTAPNADGVLPGLSEELAVWNLQFQDPPAIPIPTGDAVPLGYQLQVGTPAEPGVRSGALYLYYGEDRVGSIPIFQAGEPAAWSSSTRIAA